MLVPVQHQDEEWWTPVGWPDVLQPVAEFLRITADLFRDTQPEQAVLRAALLSKLAEAAAAFEQRSSPSTKSVGYKRVMAAVSDLQR